MKRVPYDPGHPGRVAVVQSQVVLVIILVVAQLWLVTLALDEVLSGRGSVVWLLAFASTAALGVAVMVLRAGRSASG